MSDKLVADATAGGIPGADGQFATPLGCPVGLADPNSAAVGGSLEVESPLADLSGSGGGGFAESSIDAGGGLGLGGGGGGGDDKKAKKAAAKAKKEAAKAAKKNKGKNGKAKGGDANLLNRLNDNALKSVIFVLRRCTRWHTRSHATVRVR